MVAVPNLAISLALNTIEFNFTSNFSAKEIYRFNFNKMVICCIKALNLCKVALGLLLQSSRDYANPEKKKFL